MPSGRILAQAASVVEGGNAHVRPFQLGLRTGTGLVEILSGLKAGETVVTEGSDRLDDGVPVEVVTGENPRAAAGGGPSSSPAGAAE